MIVKPGEQLTVKGIRIETVPAYNINKFSSPGVLFHPRSANHVGYNITVGGQRIYHTGDSDHIPEMKDIQVDIALLPVSGIYVMTAKEAADAARDIQPKLAIPMHVGSGIGALDDADTFKKLAPVPVQILSIEK
jgi:L-ascorbate metabolism protein UlaG (beta-lactamase superfamily)